MKTYVAHVKVIHIVEVEFDLKDNYDQSAIETRARYEGKKIFRNADDIECIEYEELI